MTLREITNAAIALVCEEPESVDTQDYKDRAAFILPTFCGHCAAIDDRYRSANAMEKKATFSSTYMDLEETFPLSAIFIAPATYYLAAMLTVDENEEMSDRFFALYTDSVASVEAGLAAVAEQISDRYVLL
ncbi:MAG: hypothetical protein IKJ35_00880 [Clostridia bacterium]|nr:hypothetical protein [Clostridia bacterium]